MARRVSLPAADHIFRGTTQNESGIRAVEAPGEGRQAGTGSARRPSGRVRHDEKVTVYVTAEELLEIEQARLTLRSRHKLAVDRGRLIREAVAIVLADLEAQGDESTLVQRLTDG